MSSIETSDRFGARLAQHDWHMLVERWQRLQPYADRFATAFFDTLFSVDPDFREVFEGASLEAQFLRFAHLMAHIVSAADNREELEHRAELIVHRFARDDSATDRSRAIKAAVVSLLAEVEAADMSSQMRASWRDVYRLVNDMLRGTWLAPRTIAQVALRAELVADRRSRAVDELMERSRESEAA